jgi:hypothetical protein
LRNHGEENIVDLQLGRTAIFAQDPRALVRSLQANAYKFPRPIVAARGRMQGHESASERQPCKKCQTARIKHFRVNERRTMVMCTQ